MSTKSKPQIPTLALEKSLDDQMDSPKIRSPLKSQQSPFFLNLDGQLNRINNLNIKAKPFSANNKDEQVTIGTKLDEKGHVVNILDTMSKQISPDEKMHHKNIQDDKTKTVHIS